MFRRCLPGGVETGVGAGISGMALAGLLLDWCTGGQADSPGGYQAYFAIVTLLLAPGFWLIRRLPPLPMEKRKIRKSWLEIV